MTITNFLNILLLFPLMSIFIILGVMSWQVEYLRKGYGLIFKDWHTWYASLISNIHYAVVLAIASVIPADEQNAINPFLYAGMLIIVLGYKYYIDTKYIVPWLDEQIA